MTVGNEKSAHYPDAHGQLYNSDGREGKKWYKDDLAKYKADSIFYDNSRRIPDSDKTINWHADLRLVGVNKDGSYTTLLKGSWGYSLAPNGTVTQEDWKEIK